MATLGETFVTKSYEKGKSKMNKKSGMHSPAAKKMASKSKTSAKKSMPKRRAM